MLCRAKAVLDVRDNEGRVPWEAAVYSGHTAVVDALMGASKEAGQAQSQSACPTQQQTRTQCPPCCPR